MIAICLGMAIQHLAVFLGSKAGAVLSGRSGLPFVWVLRKAWGWKPVSCRAISDEFAVGPRLLFELRFKFWTVFLSGHPLKGQCVFQVFGEHFHSDHPNSAPNAVGMEWFHITTLTQISREVTTFQGWRTLRRLGRPWSYREHRKVPGPRDRTN